MKKKKITKIIFIIADTLRARNVGLYGRKPSPTPNIDKLGKRGVVFDNAYASITKTDSSITSIMSGRYPISSGLTGHGKWLNEAQEKSIKKTPLMAKILKEKRYKTCAVDWFSRWHGKGYDYYSGKLIKDIDPKDIVVNKVPIIYFLRILDILAIKILRRDFFIRFYYFFFPKAKIPYDPADIVVEKAINILKKNKKKKLFLYIHFRDPHFPLSKPKKLKPCLFNSFESRYDAEIKFMDEQIGLLMEFLEKNNQLDKTLIVFTADHGEALDDHGTAMGHHSLYEEIVKIPLIFNSPYFKPKRIQNLVQHVDIMPTILDLINCSFPKNIDGKSLMPLILGKKQKSRDFVFFEDLVFGEFLIKKDERKRGLRKGDYKYIETLIGKPEDLFSLKPKNNLLIAKQELYNLKKDLYEEKNLIKKQKKLAKNLQLELRSFISFLKNKHWR